MFLAALRFGDHKQCILHMRSLRTLTSPKADEGEFVASSVISGACAVTGAPMGLLMGDSCVGATARAGVGAGGRCSGGAAKGVPVAAGIGLSIGKGVLGDVGVNVSTKSTVGVIWGEGAGVEPGGGGAVGVATGARGTLGVDVAVGSFVFGGVGVNVGSKANVGIGTRGSEGVGVGAGGGAVGATTGVPFTLGVGVADVGASTFDDIGASSIGSAVRGSSAISGLGAKVEIGGGAL